MPVKFRIKFLGFAGVALLLLAAGCSGAVQTGISIEIPPVTSDTTITLTTTRTVTESYIPETATPSSSVSTTASLAPVVTTTLPPAIPPPSPTTSVSVPVVMPEPAGPPRMVISLGTFEPGTLIVKIGTEVEFENVDHYDYRIFINGIFNHYLNSEHTYRYLFTETGTYNVWIDSVQKGETVEGIIKVTE